MQFMLIDLNLSKISNSFALQTNQSDIKPYAFVLNSDIHENYSAYRLNSNSNKFSCV